MVSEKQGHREGNLTFFSSGLIRYKGINDLVALIETIIVHDIQWQKSLTLSPEVTSN